MSGLINSVSSMGTVPFTFEESLIEKIGGLKLNTDTEGESASKKSFQCNVLEIYLNLDEEKVYPKDSGVDVSINEDTSSLEFLADCQENARFFLVKFAPPSSSLGLIYYCPESSPIREKMMYSTAKATILNELANKDIKIQKFVEIHEENEMKGTLLELKEEFSKIEGVKSNTNANEEPKKEGNIPQAASFSKPVRKGRGGARLIKGGK